MMATAISKYSFINAKLRARISQILPDEIFSQLAKASSVDAALAVLRDTPFACLEEIYSNTGDIKLAELELLKYEIDMYRNVRKFLHENSKQLIDSLLSAFEIDNLKNAIRIYFNSKIRGKFNETGSHYLLYDRIIHDIPIDLIINASSLDEIAGLCERTPYAGIIRQYGPTVKSEDSLFRLEIAFDHFYYHNLLTAIKTMDLEDQNIALRLFRVEIDLQNISWIIRFKDFYNLSLQEIFSVIIPGGSRIDNAAIEELYHASNVTVMLQGFVKGSYPGLSALLSSQVSDNTSRLLLIQRILEEIRKYEVQHILVGYPFSVGIILGFFMLKNDELRKLRMILNAKQYGTSQERIEGII